MALRSQSTRGNHACPNRAVGLTTVDARVEQLAGLDCLIVSRFDRVIDGTTVHRVHQEDACQALGRDPEAAERKGKYEFAGGPTLRQIADLLDRHAADPLSQLDQLLRAVTYNIVIGNADAHGKNISLVHSKPGEIVVAPLYDTVPTAVWPKLPTRAAMSVNGRPSLHDTTLQDIMEEARAWRLNGSEAAHVATEAAEKLLAAVGDIDAPADLQDLVADRAAAIAAG